MNRAVTTVSAGMVGAGLVYLLDPKLGRRRRAILRDKGVHFSKIVGRGLKITGRDIGHRFQGVISKGLSVFKKRSVIDNVLLQRVRAELGRAMMNPSGIKVNAMNGEVTLSGHVLQHEYRPLVKRIQRIAGVRYVVDRLTPRLPMSESIFDESEPRTRRGHWTPAKRAFAITAGVGAFLFGVRERNRAGAVVAAAGASLIGRSIANRSTRRQIASILQGAQRRHAS
jgi:hypothetical protein